MPSYRRETLIGQRDVVGEESMSVERAERLKNPNGRIDADWAWQDLRI